MTLYSKKYNNILLIFPDEAKAVTTDVISALKNLQNKLAGIPGNVILHNQFYPNYFAKCFYMEGRFNII
jgi:hypothetical protein